MIRRAFRVEGSCGEDRAFGDRWDAVCASGRARVYLRYDRERGVYQFAVAVGARQVNVCEVGAAASTPRAARLGDDALKEAARAAVSFTVDELDADPEQPGMLSGMSSGGELHSELEYDAGGAVKFTIHR